MNCPVLAQNGASRRMAMAAEAFGNKMCFLEDITLEVNTLFFLNAFEWNHRQKLQSKYFDLS